MKIGFDAKRAFFNKSGLGNYSRSILLLLQEYFPENEYLLYTPSLKDSISFQKNKLFKIKEPSTKLTQLFSSYWRSMSMSSDLKKEKLDLFHGLSNELPSDIQKSATKSIVTIHDLIFLRFPHFFSAIDNQIYLQKFKHACKAADHVVAVSEQTKHDIVNFFQISPNKISVSYQGCGQQFWQIVSEEKKQEVQKRYNLPKKFILNVGTIEPRKNMYNLIYSLLYAKHDATIVSIGRGVSSYMRELEQLIDKKGLQKRVLFLHNVTNEDLPAVYQQAEIFVYPSYFEGFGIPILEAMVSDIPVITSSGSCFPETGGDAARYINPNNPEEIAIHCDEIMSDTELQKKMVKRGRIHAEKFSDEAVVKSIMQVYHNTLEL